MTHIKNIALLWSPVVSSRNAPVDFLCQECVLVWKSHCAGASGEGGCNQITSNSERTASDCAFTCSDNSFPGPSFSDKWRQGDGGAADPGKTHQGAAGDRQNAVPGPGRAGGWDKAPLLDQSGQKAQQGLLCFLPDSGDLVLDLYHSKMDGRSGLTAAAEQHVWSAWRAGEMLNHQALKY